MKTLDGMWGPQKFVPGFGSLRLCKSQDTWGAGRSVLARAYGSALSFACLK